MATKITFKATELRRLLSNGILFAAPAKDCLPALEVVHFDWDGDHLLAVATNRYVLSYEESWPVNAEGREPFSVGVSDAKQVINLIKSAYGFEPEITVEYDGERWVTFTTLEGNIVKASTEHGQFPNWRRLTEGHKPGERETVVFNPKWLALLAKVDCDQRETVAHFRFADTPNGGPVQVTMGEHFKGLIMAVSHAG